jgi:hypothetical protein
MSDHPSLEEMLAVLSSNTSAEWLAESIVQTVERFFKDAEPPTRAFLVARGAQMVTAIRAGERLRLSLENGPDLGNGGPR